MRDIFESLGRPGLGVLLQELKLDVSTEEFLNAERAFTYADLYAIFENKKVVVWLTPHASLVRDTRIWMNYRDQLEMSHHFYFNAEGKDIVALASSSEHLLEICDVIIRLLAASAVYSVILSMSDFRDTAVLINAPTLEYLMERCRSLKV
jgi:hypothetical protein